MSTKPTIVPLFDTNGTRIAAPAGGRISDGYPLNSPIISQDLNYIFHHNGLWTQYLSDANFTGGASFAGGASVTGGLTVDTLTATGLVTVQAGVTASVNQSFAVSGTGRYQRGARVRHLPGMAGVLVSVPAATTSYFSSSGGQFQFKASADTMRIAIPLEEGEQLQSVRGYVSCSTTDVITMKLYKANAPSLGSVPAADTQVGTTQTSTDHTQVLSQLAVSGLTESITNAITWYSIEFRCSAFGSNPVVAGVDYTTVIL